MSEKIETLTKGDGETEFYQIPTNENRSTLDSAKVDFEEIEPSETPSEADPATMEKIKYFNKARMAKFGDKTLGLYLRKVA